MKSKILFRYQATFASTIITGSSFLFLYLFHNSENKTIVILLTMAIFFSPFIFMKYIISFFSRRIIIKLDQDTFSICILNRNLEEENNVQFDFSEIYSYNIYFPTKKLVCINFHLNDNQHFKYCFLKNKNSSEETPGDEVVNIIHSAFKNYNDRNSRSESKIIFSKNFLASNKGLYFIVFLSIAFLTILVFTINLKGSNNDLIQLFIYFGLILQLISKRINDIRFYNRMIE